MKDRPISSRQRFEDYKRGLHSRWKSNGAAGVAVEPRDDVGGSPARLRSATALLRDYYRLLRGQHAAVAAALALGTIATGLALVPPAGTKFLVDYVLVDAPFPETWTALGLPTNRWHVLLIGTAAIFVISIFKALFNVWSRWISTRVSKRVELTVRKRSFDHAVRLPLHRVYELKSGGVASLLRKDAHAVGELAFVMLHTPWRAVVQLFGSLCMLAWVDWRLLLGALAGLPCVYFTHRTWIGRIRPQNRDIRARRMEVDAQTTEVFGGMRVVRAFSRQRSEASRLMRGNNLMLRQELRLWWLGRAVELIWAAVIPLLSAALVLYGGQQVLQGSLTLGDLMMFLVYMLMLLSPLAALAQSAASFQDGLSALDRILDLLAEPLEFASQGGKRSVDKKSTLGRITLENVSFRHRGAVGDALRDISIDVEPGTTVALVGPSGAGKTTLCNLVARFYDPTSGRILLDGTDLREFDVESYRGVLGVVEQEVFLFDGTVSENIGYANRDAGEVAIRRAAEVANADEFIRELPGGYSAVIGERGVKLSGGQRQRLAIARAVLADPRILILDEATSNLDSRGEQLIQQSLDILTANRTTFVIAHRLSTITHAARIIVLENGAIREVGTHAQLMEVDGHYRAMIQLQIDQYADIDPGRQPVG